MLNWERLREDFVITKKYAYLANAAASPIPKPVRDKAVTFYNDMLNYGDILWDRWLEEIEQTRIEYAKFIGADSKEIGFTHSTTEGMNIIAHMLSNKGKVISNELEFPSSNLPWLNIGADICFVKARNGKILIKDIVNNINGRTGTIITSHVQYSTGFRQDLVELSNLTKQKGLYLVVNPTQSIGALYFDVKEFGIDFMASDGHKWIISSYGVGVIYIRKRLLDDLDFKPPFFGQLGQKHRNTFNNMKLDISQSASRFELGSPHFPNIFALNAGIKYISKIGVMEIEKRILYLTRYLIEKLQELNLCILSPLEEKHRSGIVVFKVDNTEEIIRKLEKEMIIVSARGGGIRVSPHFYNNEEDIDRLISVLKNSVRC